MYYVDTSTKSVPVTGIASMRYDPGALAIEVRDSSGDNSYIEGIASEAHAQVIIAAVLGTKITIPPEE